MQKRDKESYELYRLSRNKINNLIEKSKKKYYQRYFSDCGKNSKKVWNGINSLICGVKNIETISCIKNGSKVETDLQNISNTLNTYYSKVAQNLTDKLDNRSVPHFSTYLKNHNRDNTFVIKKVLPNEVEKEIDALSKNKAEDAYSMNIKMIKILSTDLAPVLREIFNSSFEEGIFPDLLKLAKVTPIYKSGDKMEPGNFRPVSVLPVFDKILEKLMKKQLMEYLNIHKILK